ncbi:MAG: Hsp20/alpha crystallin family protein [Vicinamibacterales bacterium]
MSLTRLDPFREFATIQDRMNRLFGDAYLRQNDDVAARGNWVPAVDIYETPQKDVVLKVDLPDVAREDIEVTVEHNTLTLKGTRKAAADVKEEQYRRIERAYGTFVRSFTLPSTVDAGKVGADYKNGVLTVTLPYKEEAKPRNIAVQVSAS